MSLMISSTATFASSDIKESLAYYKDVLGFETTWTYGDPPVFGSVSKGNVTITFSLQPDLAARIRGHQHGIKVDDVDDLYNFHISTGATVISEIQDKPWGMREYVVEDINGYHITFSGLPSSNTPKSAPLPDGVTFEHRKPTSEEFVTVAGQAFEYKHFAPEILENTWNGVVALSPNDHAIGVLRIMWDAPGWFSIWDVAVLPEWQSQSIGTTMMREALATIREASPRANVHLFTYKHGFYERLGFEKDTVSILRL